ncbi:MAG: carboxypeptidase regulatory-like domain-containing protein [Pirellulaceae bacterium]
MQIQMLPRYIFLALTTIINGARRSLAVSHLPQCTFLTLTIIVLQQSLCEAQEELPNANDSQLTRPQQISPSENGIHGYVYGKEVSADAAGDSKIHDLGTIANAKIELQLASGLRIGTATTNDQGFYSFPSVASGRIEYTVSAEGYQDETNGRAFDLPEGYENRVVNFTLVKGESQNATPPAPAPQISVSVLVDRDGQSHAVEQASILVWKTGNEGDQIIVDAPHGKTPQPIPLTAGDWTVMANTAEFGMSPSTSITLSEGQTANHEIIYPESISDIRALVKVVGPATPTGDLDAGETNEPSVHFVKSGSVSNSSGAVPTRVTPITAEELSAIAGEASTDRWYWATPVQPLSVGQEYLARAELNGFESADSPPRVVEKTGVKVFHVDLLGADQLSSLAGMVELEADGVRRPLPDASLRFEHESLGLVKEVRTDEAGHYHANMAPGDWWGKVVSVSSEPDQGPSDLIRINVPKGGSATMNFLLSQSTALTQARQVRALVNVKPSGNPSVGKPTVTFVRDSGEQIATTVSAPTQAELAGLGLSAQGEESGWFWATPVNELAVGTYRAESNLEGYFSDTTSKQVVAEQAVTVFHLTMRPQVQLGKLAGYVRDRATSEVLAGATIEISPLADSPLRTSVNGSYGPVELSQGDYLVVASAPGYFSRTVSAQVVQSKNTRSDIELERQPVVHSTNVRAIVTVLKTPGCEPQEPPLIDFINESYGLSQNENLSVGLANAERTPPTLSSTRSVLTRLSSSELTDVFVAEPVEPLSPGSYRAIASLAHYGSQVSANRNVGLNPVVFRMVLRHETAVVPLAFYAWKETPDQIQKLKQVQELSQLLSRADPLADRTLLDKRKSELRTLRQLSLTGVDVILWPDGSPWNSMRVPVKKTVAVQPGYWWYLPSSFSGPEGSVVPQRITVPCSGLELDFTTASQQGDQASGSAVVFVRTDANTDSSIAELAPNQYWLAPVDASGNPMLDKKLRLTAHTSRVAKGGGRAWHWFDVNQQRLAPGNYMAFAGRSTDRSTDSSIKTVVAGSTTVFGLSLASPKLPPQPNELFVSVATTSPEDIPSGVGVVAKNSATNETRAIPATSGFGSAGAGMAGQNFQSELPAGTWSVEAFADGYETVQQPFPVQLTSGDQESVAIVLKKIPVEPETAMVEALIRVERLLGSASAQQPAVSFLLQSQSALDPLSSSSSNAMISPASSTLLQSRGYNPDEYPNSDWFVAAPNRPMLAGSITVNATLPGYRSVSVQKPALAGLSNNFYLELAPIPTTLHAIAVNAYDGQPLPDIEVTVRPPASNEAAYSQTTDQRGSIAFDLKHGAGTYQVHLAGKAIEKEIDIPVEISAGENEQQFQVTLPATANKFIVYGTVSIREKVMQTKGQQVVEADVTKKISGASVLLEPVSGAKLPSAVTDTQSSEQGFEFRDLSQGEYVVTASYPGWNVATQTIQVRLGGETNRIGPIELVLEKCDVEYEQLLAQIVNEGWDNLAKAQKSYQLAQQRLPDSPRAEYALALASIKHKRFSTAKKSLASVIRLRNQDPMWDRASEAYIWVDLEIGNLAAAKKGVASIESIQRIYATREENYGSLDTARLLGIGAGMLQGPWKDMPIGKNGTQLGEQLASTLSAQHSEKVIAGIDEVLSRFREESQKIAQSEASDRERAAELKEQRAAMAEERITYLQLELDQIASDVNSRRAETEQACQFAQAEALPLKQAYNAKAAYLNGRIRDVNILVQELNNLPQGGGDGGGGGGGGFGGFGGAMMQNDRKMSLPQSPETIGLPKTILAQIGQFDQRREQLKRQILTMKLENTAMKQELAQLSTAIQLAQARCNAASQQFNVYLQQQNARANQIRRDMEALRRDATASDEGLAKSPETRELEKGLENLSTYFTYPLEQRRQEFLNGLGCGAGETKKTYF